MRLDKCIASQGKYSRSDIKKLIKQGLVEVNGIAAQNAAMQVDPSSMEIFVESKPLDYKEHVYIMLNKPKGVVSATEDRDKPTVIDLLPKDMRRDGLFPAGRLDADTTGFVLITDDGDFAHRILSPKNHIQKTYLATLADKIKPEDIEELENGILLKDGSRCLPAKVNVLSDTLVEIKICEGKYHQIKRMFAARGNKVLELKRTHMGLLPLSESLGPGECREITSEELLYIEQKG